MRVLFTHTIDKLRNFLFHSIIHPPILSHILHKKIHCKQSQHSYPSFTLDGRPFIHHTSRIIAHKFHLNIPYPIHTQQTNTNPQRNNPISSLHDDKIDIKFSQYYCYYCYCYCYYYYIPITYLRYNTTYT